MSRTPTARDVALLALLRVDRDGAFSNRALEVEARAAGIGATERPLATELVYGTLAWRGRLDAALGRYARKPLRKLPPVVLAAMRLAAYQLLFLHRVEPGLAVSAAVAQSRAAVGATLGGVANAILRALARDAPTLHDDAFRQGGPEATLSVPSWLYRRWQDRYGEREARALSSSINRPAVLHVRVNTARITREALAERLAADGAACESLRAPAGLAVRGLRAPFAHSTWNEGLWTAQDEAAQLVTELVAPTPGRRILDACAGFGGKALHIAERVGDRGQVVALDNAPDKLAALRREAERLGVCNLETHRGDATDEQRVREIVLAAGVDAALVDAPCTGLGTLRRHPEIKWRRRPTDLPRAAELQSRLLRSVAAALPTGATLVYAVCSTEPEEGTAVMDAFLGAHPAWRLAPLCADARVDWASLVSDRGVFCTLPHVHGCDGFQAARLVKP